MAIGTRPPGLLVGKAGIRCTGNRSVGTSIRRGPGPDGAWNRGQARKLEWLEFANSLGFWRDAGRDGAGVGDARRWGGRGVGLVGLGRMIVFWRDWAGFDGTRILGVPRS